MKRVVMWAAIAVAGAYLALVAIGALPREAGPGCRVLWDRGPMHGVVCPWGTERPGLVATGKEVCRGARPCNVWIWTDEARAATGLPMTDAQADAAVAVWHEQTGELNVCAEVGC